MYYYYTTSNMNNQSEVDASLPSPQKLQAAAPNRDDVSTE